MAEIDNPLCDRTSRKFNGNHLTRTFGAKTYRNLISVLLSSFPAKKMRAKDIIDEGVLFLLSLFLRTIFVLLILILVNSSLTFSFVIGEMRKREENNGVPSLLSFVKGMKSEQHKVLYTQLLKISQYYPYFSDTPAKNKEKFTRQ